MPNAHCTMLSVRDKSSLVIDKILIYSSKTQLVASIVRQWQRRKFKLLFDQRSSMTDIRQSHRGSTSHCRSVTKNTARDAGKRVLVWIWEHLTFAALLLLKNTAIELHSPQINTNCLVSDKDKLCLLPIHG